MNIVVPLIISSIALVVSVASLAFIIWSREENKRVQAAGKSTQLQGVMKDLFIAIDRELMQLEDLIVVAEKMGTAHIEDVIADRVTIHSNQERLKAMRDRFDAKLWVPTDGTVSTLKVFLSGLVKRSVQIAREIKTHVEASGLTT